MPQKTMKLRWELDYKPEPKNRTGYNLFLKTLPKCNWGNEQGKRVVRRKFPQVIKDYAKLNRSLQAHIYSQYAKRARNSEGELFYNMTFHQ